MDESMIGDILSGTPPRDDDGLESYMGRGTDLGTSPEDATKVFSLERDVEHAARLSRPVHAQVCTVCAPIAQLPHTCECTDSDRLRRLHMAVGTCCRRHQSQTALHALVQITHRSARRGRLHLKVARTLGKGGLGVVTVQRRVSPPLPHLSFCCVSGGHAALLLLIATETKDDPQYRKKGKQGRKGKQQPAAAAGHANGHDGHAAGNAAAQPPHYESAQESAAQAGEAATMSSEQQAYYHVSGSS